MHRVFEILRLIPSSIKYEDREDASCFACCCKSFSTLTFDIIWGRYQPYFTTLLQTLLPLAPTTPTLDVRQILVSVIVILRGVIWTSTMLKVFSDV